MVTNQVPIPGLQSRRQISTRGWSLKNILENSKNFKPVPRYSLKDVTHAIQAFESDGIPLIIQGLHEESKWPKKEFEPAWLLKHGQKEINVRNVHNWADKSIPLAKFIENCRAAPEFAPLEEQERNYGKDAECPEMWNKWLHQSQVVPPSLTPNHVDNLLLSYHVETLMCYLGIGDTFTPCHKDLCASSGQNLMCYTENNGSSFWFMTKEADAPEASKYFQQLNQELDHETHVMTLEQLSDAPFDVFVAEQKLGDLVLVPPRSCHQVVNYGGLTIKTSWSRMTLKGLETAYYHELPVYRRVCRPEIYRVRSTIYLTLTKKRDELARSMRPNRVMTTADKKLTSATQTLLQLFEWILLEESPPPWRKIHCLYPSSATDLNTSSDVNDLTCDFCGADIFQSFFECLLCVPFPQAKHGDGFIICPGCYIDGRACSCGNMEPMQCRSFEALVAFREEVTNLLAKSGPSESNPRFSERLSGVDNPAPGCRLQKSRKDSLSRRKTCSSMTKPDFSHVVDPSWLLPCKKCHRSRCFWHILTSQKLHAADALLVYLSDSSHEEYHRHHRNSVQSYQDGRNPFFEAQRRGTEPDSTQQRVHLAEQYQTCKPINAKFMQGGWYDVYIQVPMAPCEDGTLDSAVPEYSPLTTLSSTPSSLTDLASAPDDNLPETDSSEAPGSGLLKRKRLVFDGVEATSHPKLSRT